MSGNSKKFTNGSNVHNGGSISNSGSNRARNDTRHKGSDNKGLLDRMASFGTPKKSKPVSLFGNSSYGSGGYKPTGGTGLKKKGW